MAQDLKPSTWIASWSENGTNVTFPIASVPELTAAEADADTGNISKVLFAICEKIYAEVQTAGMQSLPDLTWLQGSTPAVEIDKLAAAEAKKILEEEQTNKKEA